MTVKASTISRFLGKSFERSESFSTAIRGWQNYSPGFQVTQAGDSARVEFVSGDDSRRQTAEQQNTRRAAAVASYAKALEDRYTVTDHKYGGLLVSEKEGTAPVAPAADKPVFQNGGNDRLTDNMKGEIRQAAENSHQGTVAYAASKTLDALITRGLVTRDHNVADNNGAPWHYPVLTAEGWSYAREVLGIERPADPDRFSEEEALETAYSEVPTARELVEDGRCGAVDAADLDACGHCADCSPVLDLTEEEVHAPYPGFLRLRDFPVIASYVPVGWLASDRITRVTLRWAGPSARSHGPSGQDRVKTVLGTVEYRIQTDRGSQVHCHEGTVYVLADSRVWVIETEASLPTVHRLQGDRPVSARFLGCACSVGEGHAPDCQYRVSMPTGEELPMADIRCLWNPGTNSWSCNGHPSCPVHGADAPESLRVAGEIVQTHLGLTPGSGPRRDPSADSMAATWEGPDMTGTLPDGTPFTADLKTDADRLIPIPDSVAAQVSGLKASLATGRDAGTGSVHPTGVYYGVPVPRSMAVNWDSGEALAWSRGVLAAQKAAREAGPSGEIVYAVAFAVRAGHGNAMARRFVDTLVENSLLGQRRQYGPVLKNLMES